jgi:hypothetical protein
MSLSRYLLPYDRLSQVKRQAAMGWRVRNPMGNKGIMIRITNVE